MTSDEMMEYHRQWLQENRAGGSDTSSRPFANIDLWEDERMVLNRLFYLVHSLSQAGLRYYIYYAENTFAKDANDDLVLISSTYHIL